MRAEQLPIVYREVPKNPANFPDQKGFLLDSFLTLEHPLIGTVALTRKRTQYVTGPADTMIVPLDLNASQLTELTVVQGHVFFEVCGCVAAAMLELAGNGYPVIAVNQQPECVNIPQKFASDGTELKVQTIDHLHSHVFIEDGAGVRGKKIAELDSASRNDFLDRLGLAASHLLLARINRKLVEFSFRPVAFFSESKFPLGINIPFIGGIRGLMANKKVFRLVTEVQEDLIELYGSVEGHMLDEDKERKKRQLELFLSGLDAPASVKNYLLTVAMAIKKDAAGLEKHLHLVMGPAMTWIFFEKEKKTFINLTPRFFSRGNAMEALGIWVEPIEVNKEKNLASQDAFYRLLMVKLGKLFNTEAGQVLLEYEKERKQQKFRGS